MIKKASLFDLVDEFNELKQAYSNTTAFEDMNSLLHTMSLIRREIIIRCDGYLAATYVEERDKPGPISSDKTLSTGERLRLKIRNYEEPVTIELEARWKNKSTREAFELLSSLRRVPLNATPALTSKVSSSPFASWEHDNEYYTVFKFEY